MGQMQTPSMVHTEFDHMCELLDDFEHLHPQGQAPVAPRGHLGRDDGDETPIDDQILAGLVSPV